MEVIVAKDSESVAELAAQRFTEMLRRKPDAVLGLATGSTPIPVYQKLVNRYKSQRISFAHVTTFNLDEYIGLEPQSHQSYRQYMQKHFFSHIDIDSNKTHLPSCAPSHDPMIVSQKYEQVIAEAGGIDLQLLGIGSNGHIGFNEPISSLASRTRIKTLSKQTIADNARLFEDGKFQPHLAITMGIGTIMESRQIIILATGERKANTVKHAIEGPVSAMHPASVLQMHPKATFVIDEAAASELALVDYYRWCYSEKQRLLK